MKKDFVYDSANLDQSWALTGILDEHPLDTPASNRYATISYDPTGLATQAYSGKNAENYSVSYVKPPGQVTRLVRTLSNPLGSAVYLDIHEFTRPVGISIQFPNDANITLREQKVAGDPNLPDQGQFYAGGFGQPGGAGCAASSSTLVYDANENISEAVDFNGTRRCYGYDVTRGLQTLVLEGRADTNACSFVPAVGDASHPERLTTTVWHPDWALKAREAEAGKITTWAYNGQPDPIAGGTASCVTPMTTLSDGKPLAVVCTRYEQATTDTTGGLGLSATVTGATRAWTYTYNQYGQVLTETTPKQSPTDSLSHTTRYAYYPTTSFSGSVGYTVGDLNTITNPLGQVTTFTSYDKAGRLISSTDANLTVTSMTYWPRGWLHTQTIAPASGVALTTTYDYWPTGLLKMVTMPDASTLNYTYDDAHRLTDITDAASNKIHYVLDNVGNRTGEQISDSSGTLASSVARVYDALSRLQSTTGVTR